MEQEKTRISDLSNIMTISEQDKSKIYLASAPRYHFPVVVKELIGDHTNIYERLQKIHSKYIPKIFEVIQDGEKTYVIEEYVDGMTLDEISMQSLIDKDRLIDYIEQLCRALTSLHQCQPPIIYRDLKPSNIIITEEGILKLIDFDASREYKIDHKEDTRLLGTMEYAAPEQFGYSQTDERSDIYALGIVLSELIFGKSSSYTTNLPKIDLSTKECMNYRRIIKKCTMFSPDERYQSVDKVLQEVGKGRKDRRRYAIKMLAIMVCCIMIGISLPFVRMFINSKLEKNEMRDLQSSNVIVESSDALNLADNMINDLSNEMQDSSNNQDSSSEKQDNNPEIQNDSVEKQDNNTVKQDNAKKQDNDTEAQDISDAEDKSSEQGTGSKDAVTNVNQKDNDIKEKQVEQDKEQSSDTVKEDSNDTVKENSSDTTKENSTNEAESSELTSQRKMLSSNTVIQHFYKKYNNELRFNSEDFIDASIQSVKYQKVGDDINYNMSSNGYELKGGILYLKAQGLKELENCYYAINVELGKVCWTYYVLIHNDNEDINTSDTSIANSWKYYHVNENNDVTYLVNNTTATIDEVIISGKIVSKDNYSLICNKQGVTFKSSYLKQYRNAEQIDFILNLSDGTELVDAILIEK
jgi:serine/threonine protein kinase